MAGNQAPEDTESLKMVSVTDDSDGEYLDDPITLIDSEQKRNRDISFPAQEIIELDDSDEDIISLSPPKPTELPKPARFSYKTVSATLSKAFFKISRNIELLNKCIPLRINIVDCVKNSRYYRRKYKNINIENPTLLVRNNTKKYRNPVSVDEETMKLKIRPVDVECYMKSPIRDIRDRQNNYNLSKPVLKGSDKKNVPLPNIDFKKNQGLVGLRIVYDINIGVSNSKIQADEQIKTPKFDSDNVIGKNDEINGFPKNHSKKRDIEPAPALVSTTNSEHSKKIKNEEKNKQSNSESQKLQSISKFKEDKMFEEKKSRQAKVAVVSKKDTIKKCSERKMKSKASGKEQKVTVQTKIAETLKIEQKKCSNIKETARASEKNEVQVIYNEKNKIIKKVTKSKPAITKTLERDAISKNENLPAITKTTSDITKGIGKDKLESLKVSKTLQQKIIKNCEHQQGNSQKSEIGTYQDHLPLSFARVPAVLSRQNKQNKSLIPPNKEVSNDIKLDAHNHLPLPSIAIPPNEKSYVIADINDRKIDVFTPRMSGGWKNRGQSNTKEMLSFDLTSDSKNNIKTYAKTKSIPESQYIRFNEDTTDNTIANRSRTPHTFKVSNNQPNVKSVLKIPTPSKQEKKSELQQKQHMSKQKLIIGRPENIPNKQAPAFNKKVVVYPESHHNTLAENNRTTTSQTAQEKRSVCNETLATSHNGFSTLSVPTSIHQMLPSLDPRCQYRIVSQNKSLPKEHSNSSQTLLPKKLVSTPPPNTKTPPNILSHARFIIKRFNSESNYIPGQKPAEKQYSHGKESPTLKFIPTLTSTQKGHYIIVNNKFIDKNILVREQHKNFGPYQEQLQQYTMPKQDNTTVQNQKSSQYSVPSVSLHKNQVTPKENSANKPNPCRQNQLRKQNSTQYPNPQASQPSVSAHNHSQHVVQAPLPNLPPHPNPRLSFHVQNKHAQYYNENTHLNQVPLSNQQLKQNERGSYYNNNEMLNTEQASLPTKPNEYKSNYNQNTLDNTYQASAQHQQIPNEHRPCTNQNTILNLDTNTFMQPPPLNDYVSQNMNDTDCAYWNGVNYLGDEWLQGYPQLTQPPPPAYPPPPSDYQHLSFPQHLPPPPTMQHPQLSMNSQFPPSTPVPQHPIQISQNPPPPAATSYPQPTIFNQYPPPLAPEHLPPSDPQYRLPSAPQQPPSAPQYFPPSVFQHPPPSAPQHPPPSGPQYPPPSALQYPPPSASQHTPPLVSQHPPPLAPQHPPPLAPQHPPPLASQHPRPLAPQHPLPSIPQHPSKSASQHTPPRAPQHPPPLASQHPRPSAPQHPAPLAPQHPPPSSLQHPPPSALQHPPPTALQQPPPSAPQHPPPSALQHPAPSTPEHPPPSTPENPSQSVPQHPTPSAPQHPLPPAPKHPTLSLLPPSTYMSTTFTQGSTILGSNNSGVVRTINLMTSTTAEPRVAVSNSASTDANNIPVNTKLEMLKELSKSMELESPNLKRPLNDPRELSKFSNGKPLSGPLTKVRKLEGLVIDPYSTQKALNNGYSPPILPIPTYEKTFEYIAQVSGLIEKTPNRNDASGDKCDNKKIEGTLKKKSDSDVCADGDKGEKYIKKISIDEYKTRANNNKHEEKVVVKTEIKTESKFDDTDLGYDSDSTVILV